MAATWGGGGGGGTGPAGPAGKSAYQSWLDAGNVGTESDFLAALVGPGGPVGPAGPTGATGPAGPAGPAGATGPMGPQGPQGPAGSDGRTFVWRGVWDPAVAYAADDLVQHNGGSWIALRANTNVTPAANSLDWDELALAGATGPTGPQGPTGATGPAGPEGPAGPTGPQGPQGARGVTPRGAWSGTVAYAVDDLARYNGSEYRRLVAGTTATAPDADATNWELFVAKGDTGATGATGAQGPAGVSTFRRDRTWAYNGTPPVEAMPGYFVTLRTGQAESWLGLRAALAVGTATVEVRRNGTAIQTVNVTATAATTTLATPVALADGDHVTLAVTAASADANDLTVSGIVEVTV